MTFFDFLFGIIVITCVLGVGVVGASVLGITKIWQYAHRRLAGPKQPKRITRVSTHNRPHAPAGVSQDEVDENAQATRAPRDQKSRGTRPPAPNPNSSQRNSANVSHARSYEYLDVDAGADANKIRHAMAPYRDDIVVGPYACHVFEVLDAADLRRKSIFAEINNKFKQSTISWDHFATTAEDALDALLRNCALLANRVQAFDVADYCRMRDFFATGGAQRINTQDPARLQRWRLLHDTKAEMDDIQKTNESLLLELSKLESELGKLSSSEASEENTRIAEEVRKLADETKLYR